MSTVDRALALLTGDDAPPAQPPSARTIEKAVAWEIEDEIAAKTGRARFGRSRPWRATSTPSRNQ